MEKRLASIPSIPTSIKPQKKSRWIWFLLLLFIIVYLSIYFYPGGKREPKPFFAGDKPLVIAHQGGAHLGPSNTMVAFLQAYTLGVDVLELDIHMTKDGHLVVIHDDTVDRTTNGSGRVDQFTLIELQRLDAGYHFKDLSGNHSYRGRGIYIPTLEEVFQTFDDMRFNIEIKGQYPKGEESQIEEKLWELIHTYRFEDKVLVASFDQKIIDRFNQYAKGRVAMSGGTQEITKFVLLHKLFLNGLYKPKVDAVQIPVKESIFDLTDPKIIKGAHKRGMDVHYWTINEMDDMRFLIEQGADGIITDRPDLLLKVLKEYWP